MFMDQPSVVSNSLDEASEPSLHQHWKTICVLILQGLSASHLCVFVCVYQPPEQPESKVRLTASQTGVWQWSHIFPELENLFPVVSRAVGMPPKAVKEL